MNNLRRITNSDIENNSFLQVPNFLFKGEFRFLSNHAKLLYGLLKQRQQISNKNGWRNENDEVFFIFTRKEASQKLGLAKNTTCKIFNELLESGLLEEIPTKGRAKANHLFLFAPAGDYKPMGLDFDNNKKNEAGNTDYNRGSESCGSKIDPYNKQAGKPLENNDSEENKGQKMTPKKADFNCGSKIEYYRGQFLTPNNNIYNNTNNTYNHVMSCHDYKEHEGNTIEMTCQEEIENNFINNQEDIRLIVREELRTLIKDELKEGLTEYKQSKELIKTKKTKENGLTKSEYEDIKDRVAANIDLDYFRDVRNEKIIDDIYNTMINAIISNEEYITFNSAKGVKVKQFIVKEKLLNITSSHINQVIEQFNNNCQRITNVSKYLLRCLYDASMSLNGFYANKVLFTQYGA